MSDPNEYNNYDELIEKEKALRLTWKKLDNTTMTGGSQSQSQSQSQLQLHPQTNEIMKKYLNGPERILCFMNNNRYKIITGMDLNSDATILINMFADKGIKIEMTYDNPNIPVDMRLRKITLRQVIKDKKYIFCDIYNCASYGLIPLRDENEVCNIVKMRILLIDYWIMLIMFHMGVIVSEFAIEMCNNFRKEYMSMETDKCTLKVIGKIESYDIYIKRKYRDKFVAPYIPCMASN